MIYIRLLISFFYVGLFGIGGGYATLPLIQDQVVTLHQWLSMKEFTDVITISQMTPVPIAINSATFVGIRVAGGLGAVVATLGCILPSCIIVMLVSHFYFKYRNLSLVQGILGGLRPAVVALIASAGISILLLALFNLPAVSLPLPKADIKALALFVGSLAVLRIWKIDPIYVMMGTAVAGIIAYRLL
ncbi:MAG: chromate transporter [Treponema sp.]|jgi:chromate transporter|nr:chromate transporter [Treponema sp.]